MKKFVLSMLYRFPTFHLFFHLFRPRISSMKGGIQAVHDKFSMDDGNNRIAVDLGCGPNPANNFKVKNNWGVDLYENKNMNVFKCRLGFEKLPFDDNSIDYLTAYDLLEHIPRYAELPEQRNTPFIYLMNECYRVLKVDGIFLSKTPIYPYLAAFQDPTHNNIMTVDTFKLYFSDKADHIAKHYGITAEFKILYQSMLGAHLIAVLRK